MSAVFPKITASTRLADPLAAFIARAEARAMLWAAGEFDLHEAVDKLQADAERDGLVRSLGQDSVQKIIATVFKVVRDDLDPAPGPEPPVEPTAEDVPSTFADQCRAADEKQRRKPRDPKLDRLRAMADESLERASHELNRDRPVAIATLQAAEFLMRVGDPQRWRKWFDAHSVQERVAILQHLEARKRRRGT